MHKGYEAPCAGGMCVSGCTGVLHSTRKKPPFRMRTTAARKNSFVGEELSLSLPVLCQHACTGPSSMVSRRVQTPGNQFLARLLLVGTFLVQATVVTAGVATSYVTLHLQENVSIAKVKFPLVPAMYEKAYTYDTLRTFERYGALTLTPNKIAVMYNWCQDQDTYANDSAGHLYLACKVRIEFFSPSGERLQQEFYNTAGILQVQRSFTFFDPEKFPEMKAIGFWVHGPNEGALSNKIVLALWTALCPDPDATRECVGGTNGCLISLQKRVAAGAGGSASESFEDTCTSELFELPRLRAKAGLRLCDAGEGTTPWPYQSASDCFYYDLSLTDAAGNGWEKPADGKADGYRLGSINTISKDGGRYGSVYLVRFSAGGTTVEWIRRISSHAFLDYGEGIANAVHAGEAVINAAASDVPATEMQYSVTFHSHYWKKSSNGKVSLKRLCHVQIVRENGDLVDAASGGLLNTKCSHCSSPPMVRVHPQSHQWMSVCSSSSGDAPGIYLNDNLVVDSLDFLRPGGVTSLDPDTLFSIDSEPQIVPTGVNEWLLFWKTLVIFPSTPVELFGPFVQAGKLMLAKYDASAKALSTSPSVITGGLSEPEYRSPRISRFGQKTLLVGFYSSLKQTTTLLEIYEDGRIITTAELQMDRTLVGVPLNRASATDWQHHTDNTVYWLDRVVHSEGFDQYEALRPATGYPGLSLQLLKIQGHTRDGACEVQWDQSATCDNSCHILQALQEITPGTNCPLPVGSLKATPCSSGSLCEPIKVTEVVQVSLHNLIPAEAKSARGESLKLSSQQSSVASVDGVGPAVGNATPTTAPSLSAEGSRTQSLRFAPSETTAGAKLSSHTKGWQSNTPVVSGAAGGRETAEATPSLVSLLFDRDITTAIEFASADSSSFAVFFDGGADIHEFSVAFLLDADKWEEGLRLFCAAYDRFGKALVVREGFIGRLPPRNFLQPAGVNVSYWQWRNMRLFGVRVVQCTSGSPYLLPSSASPLAVNYGLRTPSSSTPSVLPASSSASPPRSRQAWSSSDGHTAGFLSSSPAHPPTGGTFIYSDSNFVNITPQTRIKFPYASTASEASSTALRVAELVVLGRPNEGSACPPEGFFSHANCSSEASRPVFDLATLDCKGDWSEWTACDASCTSLRVFHKRQEAAWGGRPCQRIQKKPCGDGPYCAASTFPSSISGGEPLLPRQRPCTYATGSWSACLHCRQLRFHQILVEAAGPNVEPCPDPIEMRYCNESCRVQYDFAYTATSTYPPVTTQKTPLPTFIPTPKVTDPLSWRRWYLLGRYTIVGICLLAVLLLAVLAACVLCSFKEGVRQQEQQACAGSTADGPAVSRTPVTLAGLRRRTAAALHAAITAVVEFAEEPKAHPAGKSEGDNIAAESKSAEEHRAVACEKTFSGDADCSPQLHQRSEPLEIRIKSMSTNRFETSCHSALRCLETLQIEEVATARPGGDSVACESRARTAVHAEQIPNGFTSSRALQTGDCDPELCRTSPAARPQESQDAPSAAALGSAIDVAVTTDVEDDSSCEWEDIDTNSPVTSVTRIESCQVNVDQFTARDGIVEREQGCHRWSQRCRHLPRFLRRRSSESARRITFVVDERPAGVRGLLWRRCAPLKHK